MRYPSIEGFLEVLGHRSDVSDLLAVAIIVFVFPGRDLQIADPVEHRLGIDWVDVGPLKRGVSTSKSR